jgi:hypothetical protein
VCVAALAISRPFIDTPWTGFSIRDRLSFVLRNIETQSRFFVAKFIQVGMYRVNVTVYFQEDSVSGEPQTRGTI